MALAFPVAPDRVDNGWFSQVLLLMSSALRFCALALPTSDGYQTRAGCYIWLV
jgi:hypothetical protein